ncbi:MAG TPA: histone deacetylase family protein [Gammaproteobacteria bacterium]
MTLAYITHPVFLLHEMGANHPECPSRLNAINDQLIASGLDMILGHYEAPLADDAKICQVHDAEFLQHLYDLVPEQGLVHITPDTALNSHTMEAATHGAGAVILGVDLVMQKKHEVAFCAVRPPGHHAERDEAMGLCFLNNIAIGARHALDVYGLERIVIVDFDVHHGNGTEDIFRNDERVLFCSSFQHPFYPFTGADTTTRNAVNVPLPAGTDGEVFRAAISESWLPAINRFKPQLVMISAGFDGHAQDYVSDWNLTEQDYFWVTRELKLIADKYAEGRVVSALEGGYDTSALARSVVAHLKALMGYDSML